MKNKIFGYARVSSIGQNLARQMKELLDFGIDERDIYADKKSGKDFNREQYQNLLNNLREGDMLVVYSIDRLGRNYTEIQEQWDYITKTIKAHIKVLDMPLLDTSTNKDSLDANFIADLVLQILSYVAAKERENNKIRQSKGYEAMPIDAEGKRYSRKTGRRMGRPSAEYPANWKEYYDKWKAKEITATNCMKELGLTRNTFYKLAKKYEEE